MKDDFVKLISAVDDIEHYFHKTGGNGLIEIEEIHDVQEFQNWLQELQMELQIIYDQTADAFIKSTLDIVNSPFNGWNDRKDFIAIKGKILAISKNLDRYYSEINSKNIHGEREATAKIMKKTSKIFISHSTSDKSYVKKLVKLLHNFGLQQNQIFCSSLPGYDIPIGNTIFEFLRNQFLQNDLHVIFIHSEDYYKSPVCLNEMGAAWALKTNYTSILLPGFSFKHMKGVVNSAEIAIKLDRDTAEVRDKLNQLKNNLSEEFRLEGMAGVVWEEERDIFIASIIQISQEECKNKCAVDDKKENLMEDLELTDRGYYIKKSEQLNGKDIRYCVACYQNHGKLYPFTQGSVRRDLFCSNCRAHINR